MASHPSFAVLGIACWGTMLIGLLGCQQQAGNPAVECTQCPEGLSPEALAGIHHPNLVVAEGVGSAATFGSPYYRHHLRLLMDEEAYRDLLTLFESGSATDNRVRTFLKDHLRTPSTNQTNLWRARQIAMVNKTCFVDVVPAISGEPSYPRFDVAYDRSPALDTLRGSVDIVMDIPFDGGGKGDTSDPEALAMRVIESLTTHLGQAPQRDDPRVSLLMSLVAARAVDVDTSSWTCPQ